MVEHVVSTLPGEGLATLLFFFLCYFLPFSLLVFYIDRGLVRGERRSRVSSSLGRVESEGGEEGGVFGSGWYVCTLVKILPLPAS